MKVSYLTTDSTGKLWVGTGNGIYAINNPERKPVLELPPAGFPPRAIAINIPITSLVAPSNDEVWIGTHDGLWRGRKESISKQLTDTPPDVIGSPERFFSNLVQALSVQQLADRSILWIGTARGLFRYDLFTENWRRNGQFGTQDIRAIINIPEQDTVWVASWSKGLNGLKPQNQLQAASNISEPILVLTAGNINYWAVGLDGLYRYYDSEWMRVITNQELPVKGWLQSFSQLVANHAWLGTSAGLLLYKPDSKEVTQITGSLGSADIRLLLAINQGNSELLWVGTNHGLYAGSLNKWEVLSELENRQITALVWDSSDSSLWVGTDRGLFRVTYRNNSWKVVNEFNIQNSGLGENRINVLAISRGEEGVTKLWVGTACGLSCYSY